MHFNSMVIYFFVLNGEKYLGAYQSWQVLTLMMPDLVLKN